MSPKILLLTLPLLLAGCSSLSEEECRAMSWYNQGYQDGEQGKTRTATRDYKQTCGEYGLRVDEDEWQRGYAKGLELYCIPELAYSKGAGGERIPGGLPQRHRPSSPSSSAAARSSCWSSASASCNRSWSAPSGPSISWISRIRGESDSKQRDYYRAQRERAIRHYEGVRRDYNRIRFPDRVIQFSFGS